MDQSKIAIRGSTQDHLEIADIASDLVILKDGSAVLVLEIKAVNFGLLSEQEQESIIYAYAGFLNSLNFSIQIVIRSKKKDISSYVTSLKASEDKQTNTLLKNQIAKYRDFIVQTVKDNNVLDKKFFIAIPFSALEMGIRGASGLFIKRKGLPLPKAEIVERALTILVPRRDHILRQMGRLGLKSHQLTTEELIRLFMDIYSPSAHFHTQENLPEKPPPATPNFDQLGSQSPRPLEQL